MRKELITLMCLTAFGSAEAIAQEPPENVPVPLSIRSAVTTSTEGLTEEFGISGRVVRLQGRFRSLATAKIDENANVETRCHGPGETLDAETSELVDE